MTSEEKDNLLLGLRTEVLEIKEKLADEYYSIRQMSDFVKSDELDGVLGGYYIKDEIDALLENKGSSDNNELISRIEDCATKSQLSGYVTKDLFDDVTKLYLMGINELNTDLKSHINECADTYTKEEIEAKGYLTEHQSLKHLATIDWVESRGFLREHQSLSAYATKRWVESQISGILSGVVGDDINLNEYVRKEDMPTSLSQFDNDCGFLTEHQSLEDYVTKDSLRSIKNDISVLKSKLSSSGDYSGLITMRDVESYINMLNLDSRYVKPSELPSLGDYAKKTDFISRDLKISNLFVKLDELMKLEDVENYVDSLDFDSKYARISDIPSLSGYAKIDYIARNYAMLSDIPNVSMFYTREDADDKFAEKRAVDEIYESFTPLDDFNALKELVESELPNFVTNEEFKTYCNRRFVTNTEFDELLSKLNESTETVVDITAELSKYAKYTDLMRYVSKGELENSISSFVNAYDVESIVTDKMGTYVNDYELNDYVKKDYMSHVEAHINDNIDRLDAIEKRFSKYVDKSTINQLTKDFVVVDELDRYALKSELIKYCDESLVPYAKMSDISNFITYFNVEEDFVKKSDIGLYIPSLSNYATKVDLRGINLDIVGLSTNLNKLSIKIDEIDDWKNDFYNKDEINAMFSSLNIPDAPIYVPGSGDSVIVENNVNLSEYVKKTDFNSLKKSLIDYAKLTDIPNIDNLMTVNEHDTDVNEIYAYIVENNNKYLSALSNYFNKEDIEKKLESIVKNFVSTTTLNKKMADYVKISSFDSFVEQYLNDRLAGIVENCIDTKLKNYITRNEANYTYLAIEDYKHIRDAAVLSDTYRYEPEKFFKLVYNNDGTERNVLHNGFYIVERNVFLVYNGTLTELDRIEYNWKIEE